MANKKVKTSKVKKTAKKTVKKTAKKTAMPPSRPQKKRVRAEKKGKQRTAKPGPVARKPKPPAAKPKGKKPVVKTRAGKAPGKAGKSAARESVLKRHLIQKMEDIVKEAKSEIAKYVKGETRQLVETALDDGDWSVIDLSEDINLRRLETHRGTLLRIDEALRKIKDGTYGICEDCEEKISPERLKVMPFAIYCRDCQEKREVLDKVEREEIT